MASILPHHHVISIKSFALGNDVGSTGSVTITCCSCIVGGGLWVVYLDLGGPASHSFALQRLNGHTG